MFRFGQTAVNSIALLSFLASAQARGRCGSGEIAVACKLSRALTAKLLSRLSSVGLVTGRPGRGGGYALAKEAGRITLLQVVSLIKPIDNPAACPSCADRHGGQVPCPLHELLLNLRAQYCRFLASTTLADFVEPALLH